MIVNGDTGHGFGWRPQKPDQRDALFAPRPAALKDLAVLTKADLTTSRATPPVWDQGQLGSCTAHAVGACFAFAHRTAGHRAMMPSRLHLYWHERDIEGSVDSDSGAELRDGFKVISRVGVPPESDWPYVVERFAEKPDARTEATAVRHRAMLYQAIPQALTPLKACIAGGFPFAFGFTVYESFESPEVASSGVMPMPSHSERTLGGHAVAAWGYDDERQAFLVRNSWGEDWGSPEHPGYFWMPYSYATSVELASDFWTVSSAT